MQPHKRTASESARRRGLKRERIAARVSPEQRDLIARAAALRHQPLSQFVIASALTAAQQTLQEYDTIALSARDSLAVMDALENPGEVSPRLRQAAERYCALIERSTATTQE